MTGQAEWERAPRASAGSCAGSGQARPETVPARSSARAARLRLVVLLPLTMTALVVTIGLFALRESTHYHLVYGLFGPGLARSMAGLQVQIVLVALLTAVLGVGLALGATAPLQGLTVSRAETDAWREGAGEAALRSGPEADSLAGAFNEAISALNRYIFQRMTGGVLTLDTDGRVIGSSPAAEAILGYRDDQIVGRRLNEVLAPPEGGGQGLAALEAAIERRETIEADQATVVASDGRVVRLSLTVSYLRAGEGEAGPAGDEAVGVMVSFKDLTEISSLRGRLQQADQLVALGSLTAGVAHELRNPLAALQGLVELVGRDFAGDDPRRRYVTTMLEAIDRLNRLVEDLLSLSSPGTPSPGIFDLNETVRETVMMARLGLGDRRVSLTFNETSGAMPAAGSAARLSQALANLVLNAVQATPDGGAVTVTAGHHEGEGVIRVHNTGSYIEPEQISQVFVPFHTTKPRGTGLGLAIARQIVVAHGGCLDVDSDREAGTTFSIRLPLVVQDPPDTH